jgi:AraC-like DNA-binding protein
MNPLETDLNLRQTLLSEWEDFPLLIDENNTIMYGISQDASGASCIIGPVALSPINSNDLLKYKEKHGLLKNAEFKIHHENITRTAAVLALLHEKLNHQKVDSSKIVELFYLRNNIVKVSDEEMFHHNFQKTEQVKGHLSYNLEKHIMSAMSNGDIDALTMIMKANMLDGVGTMSKIPFKQLEYITISGLTLFERAAIEGGANPEEIYSMGDLYMQKISLCQDELELQKIMIQAQFDLCECVRRSKQQNQGLNYVEQCKRYVAKNLHHPFTFDDVADSVGINKCYLTNQFTQQEGKNLKRYIHEERIKAAQNMLKYSNQSIPIIANYLCFDSQSHFGSVFKKITGMTPMVYRSKYRTENITQSQKTQINKK